MQCHKIRMEVMDRLRLIAELTPQQTADWDYFKTMWDKNGADAMEQDWARLFAEMIQKILNDLVDGRGNALSEFMHRETKRVLRNTPASMVPGAR